LSHSLSSKRPYLDICMLISIPHSTLYYSLWRTCDAINDFPELTFPSTEDELRAASEDFESISYPGITRGCNGAVDGWLCAIVVPPSAVGNLISYFSGHYQRYGLNVQAIVDHLGQFLYITVAPSGSQPDVNSFNHCGLYDILSHLPLGYLLLVITPTHPPSILSLFWRCRSE
jgi:hypothetical protein